jgi:hypothetical protein
MSVAGSLISTLCRQLTTPGGTGNAIEDHAGDGHD